MKQAKRGMIFRTLAGFLSLWLVFMGILSWNLLRQEKERTNTELTQLLALQTNLRLDGSVLQTEEMSNLLDYLCLTDSRIKAGAIFRRNGGNELLAQSDHPFRLLVTQENDNSMLQYVQFSPLACMTDEQYRQLTDLVSEYECQWLEGRAKFYETGSSDQLAYTADRIILYASGWINGESLYPERLTAAQQPFRTEGQEITGEPSEIDENDILLELQFDTENIYDIKPAGNPAYRRIENIQIVYNSLFCHDGTPMDLKKCRTALQMLRGDRRTAFRTMSEENLRTRFRLAAGPLTDLTIQTQYLSGSEQVLYTQYGDLELLLFAESHPLRDLLPTLAGIWLGCLLFTLLAGGIVCRAMCRVYNRQAELEQNRRDTANALAHDLKTPLALIRGYTENLQFGVKPEKHMHYLTQIQRETERMDSLLGGFLELSRLESGMLPLHREPLSLRPFAEECAERCREMAEAKNITLRVEGDGTISADRALFERALNNLLSNALRHTPEGGTITVTVSASGLTVENTGSPIPPEVLPHLFEAYYTGDRSRSGGRRHGLGLADCRAIAELHGLSIFAENTEHGVTFRIAQKKGERPQH